MNGESVIIIHSNGQIEARGQWTAGQLLDAGQLLINTARGVSVDLTPKPDGEQKQAHLQAQ